MATKGIRYGNKLVSLGGKGIRPPIPVQDGLVIWIDPANRKSVPLDFHTTHELSCLVSGRVSSAGSPTEYGIVEGNFLKSENTLYGPSQIPTGRLQFNFAGDEGLSATFSNSSFSIEEWYLVTNQQYPETFCGGTISGNAYATGSVGFEWNHGIQTSSLTRIKCITQPTNTVVTNTINHLTGYGAPDVWNHRVIVCNRELSSVSLYLDGDFQGSGSIATIGDDSLYDSTNAGPDALHFGYVAGWAHEGKRGPTRVYNKALSQAEITENFYAEKHRYLP